MRRPSSASLLLLLALGCRSPGPARDPGRPDAFFQRYTDPDPRGLERDIAATRADLDAARARGDRAAALRLAADLGGMLTTARREHEARATLAPALAEARRGERSETLGWLLLNLATADQYLGRRGEAAAGFAEAHAVATALGSPELEHYVLQHWGRLLVEAGELERARACFTRALELRIRLHDPRQASSRRALAALDRLQSR